MSRRSLFWPLTLIVAFAVLLIMLLAGTLPSDLAAQGGDCASIYPTPGADRDNCFRTATANASDPYPSPSATAAPVQPTSAATATFTATSTARPVTATAGPTSTVTATRAPQGSPLPTLTSTLVGLETIVCAPGVAVTLTGRAEPGTALLAYFNERPVGGTLARADGSYSIQLSVGDVRPGLYPVNIRERDGRALVRELACEVPAATPTPTFSPLP